VGMRPELKLKNTLTSIFGSFDLAHSGEISEGCLYGGGHQARGRRRAGGARIYRFDSQRTVPALSVKTIRRSNRQRNKIRVNKRISEISDRNQTLIKANQGQNNLQNAVFNDAI
jgi:hypothetical protein